MLLGQEVGRADNTPAGSPPPGATASDLSNASLEDLMQLKVYSASRYLQSRDEAPGTVTIITRTEIERYGYRTLADALRSVPGLFVTYDYQYSYLGVRGFANPGDYNTRILLMIDGHRLNDAIFQQAMLGTEFPLDIDLVQRIEVIRGPASSIYGTNAVFAVINVITRKVGELNGLEVSFDAASFNTYGGRISYGGTVHGVQAVLSGTFYGSQGAQQLFFPEYASTPSGGLAQNTDGAALTQFYADVSARGFTLQSIYGRRNKQDPTGSWDAVFNDPRDRSVDAHWLNDLRYERNLGPSWNLMARTYYDRYQYDGFFPLFDEDSKAVVLNQDVMLGERWGLQGQVTRTLAGKHHLIGGVEYRNAPAQRLSNFDLYPPLVYQQDNYPAWICAGYLQGEFDIANRLNLTVGLRYDHGSVFGDSVNPRFSLAYRPWSSGSLKLTYGTAFRSPNTYELYYAGAGSAPALSLAPERIHSFEGGFEQRLTEAIAVSGTFFYLRMSDFITGVEGSDGAIAFENLNRAESRGMEISLNAKQRNGLMATAAYSYQKGENQATESWLVGSPQHMMQGNISAPLFHTGIVGGLELQYLSPRLSLAGTELPSYVVLNATWLRKNLGRRLDVSASVYNLLNSAIFDPGAQQHVENMLRQPGRGFRVKLTLRLGAE